MQEARKRRTLATILMVLVGLAAGAVAAVSLAHYANALSASAKLSDLRVRREGSTDGYSRDAYRHWSDARENGWRIPAGTPDPGSCDTREAALMRDGTNERVGSGCSVSSGRWLDPYTGSVYKHSSDLDGDHIVPLAESFRSGSKGWSAAKKEAFANAPMEVMMVEDNANASKSDSDPREWKPPRKAYHCEYARKWVNIKYRWNLTVDRGEKRALRGMLSTC